MNAPKVIVKKIESYDAKTIADFTIDAIRTLGIKSKTHAFIKPNLVHATRYGEHAYTHPDLLRGVIRALRRYGAERQILFEDCGLMVPLRYAYRRSGYRKLCRDEKVNFLNLAEAVYDGRLKTSHGEIHEEFPIPSVLTGEGMRVFVPKLKIHAQTDITGAVKLLIGLIKRSIRLKGHHYDLNRKIVDALEAYPPTLVITDGITLGLNGAGCPDPYPLGFVIASTNAVAADVVAAHLVGFEPEKIEHLRLASERGLGPCKLSEIEIIGDEKIKPLASGIFTEKRVDELHRNIRYFEGKVHEGRHCRGGCIGFVAESLHYLNHYHAWREREKTSVAARILYGMLGQKPTQEHPREVGVVVGKFKGEVPEGFRNNLIFVGDCTSAEELKPRAHLKGCPVFMARMVYGFARHGKLMNPYIDVLEGIPFIRAFLEEKFMKLWNVITHSMRRIR